MTRGRTLVRDSRAAAQISIAISLGLFCLAVLTFLLGPAASLMWSVAIAGAVGAYARPKWVTTASPLLIPVFLLGLPGFSQGLIPLFSIALAGALVAQRAAVPVHAVIPVGLAIALLIRELGDATGQIGLFSAFAMTTTGLVVLTAAIVAPPDLEWFLLAVTAVGVIFSVTAIQSGVYTADSRAEDVLSVNANGVALLAAAGFVAGMTLLLRSGSKPLQISGGLFGALCLGGLIIGQSQGAVLGAAGGILVLCWMWKRWSILAIGLISFALYAAIFATDLAEQLGGANRTGTDLETSRSVRSQVIDQAWELFLTEPIFGVGRGNAAVYIMSDYSVAPGEALPNVPHNVGLQILTMAGILGLVACATAIALLLISRGDSRTRTFIAPLLMLFTVASFTYEWHISIIILLPAVALGAWAAVPKSRASSVPPRRLNSSSRRDGLMLATEKVVRSSD